MMAVITSAAQNKQYASDNDTDDNDERALPVIQQQCAALNSSKSVVTTTATTIQIEDIFNKILSMETIDGGVSDIDDLNNSKNSNTNNNEDDDDDEDEDDKILHDFISRIDGVDACSSASVFLSVAPCAEPIDVSESTSVQLCDAVGNYEPPQRASHMAATNGDLRRHQQPHRPHNKHHPRQQQQQQQLPQRRYSQKNSVTTTSGTEPLAAKRSLPKVLSHRERMEQIMLSSKLHLLVVILVVLDCTCVSVELLIDFILTMQDQSHPDIQRQAAIYLLSNATGSGGEQIGLLSSELNQSIVLMERLLRNMLDSGSGGGGGGGDGNKAARAAALSGVSDMLVVTSGVAAAATSPHVPEFNLTIKRNTNAYTRFHLFLVSIEGVLKYVGLGILSLFVVEITLKIIFAPSEVIRSKWGIFDAFVVLVSFVLDIILLKNKQLLHTVSGLITLFRLWRITRIINGVVMTMEKKSADKVHRLLKLVNKLKRENESLRQELFDKDLTIERYRLRLPHCDNATDTNTSLIDAAETVIK